MSIDENKRTTIWKSKYRHQGDVVTAGLTISSDSLMPNNDNAKVALHQIKVSDVGAKGRASLKSKPPPSSTDGYVQV